MTEDEVTATGQFNSLGSADFASSSSGVAAAPTAGPAAATSATAAPSGSPANKSQKAPSAQEIQAAVDTANANLATANRVMDFRVDAATGLTIATIRNSQTGAVLQQIPGANIIALARMLADWSPGKHMLLDLIA